MPVYAVPKPLPRALEKAQRLKEVEAHRRQVKAAVWARDGGRCRVCGGVAQEMHELRFRSLGGVRSTANSIAVCNYQGRGCHGYLQRHAIEVEGTNADARLIFRWAPQITEPPYRLLSKRRSQR